MTMNILGFAVDNRTETNVIYAKISIADYLEMVGPDFTNFDIQRKREKHKAYKRMRQDIMKGALLPSITLAVKPEHANTLDDLIDDEDNSGIIDLLTRGDTVNILDGLQRTYVLRDIVDSGEPFDNTQTLLLEFWVESELKHLIYRIIVLNAGQKPMSMRHQVELLFLTVKDELESEINELEIYTERDETRRRGARKFALDRIATAYQCFLTQNTVISRDNIVAQQMLDSKILDSSEDELGEEFDSFKKYLEIYADLDVEICRIYNAADSSRQIPTGASWFGGEIVMNSFFAAVASFKYSESKKDRCDTALSRLLQNLTGYDPGDDPLALEELHNILSGIQQRKVNVGNETRRIICNGFKEFFREEGEIDFKVCWLEN